MGKRKKKTKSQAAKPTPKKAHGGGRKPILHLLAVTAAIGRLSGNIADVARFFGVARSSVLQFVAKHPELQALLDDEREAMKDCVESRFYADCLKDSPAYQTSRIFFLKTQCKARGYIEKQQIEHGTIGSTQVEEEVLATRAAQSEDPTHPTAS